MKENRYSKYENQDGKMNKNRKGGGIKKYAGTKSSKTGFDTWLDCWELRVRKAWPSSNSMGVVDLRPASLFGEEIIDDPAMMTSSGGARSMASGSAPRSASIPLSPVCFDGFFLGAMTSWIRRSFLNCSCASPMFGRHFCSTYTTISDVYRAPKVNVNRSDDNTSLPPEKFNFTYIFWEDSKYSKKLSS